MAGHCLWKARGAGDGNRVTARRPGGEGRLPASPIHWGSDSHLLGCGAEHRSVPHLSRANEHRPRSPLIDFKAPPAGLEPATRGLEVHRSVRLSHGGKAHFKFSKNRPVVQNPRFVGQTVPRLQGATLHDAQLFIRPDVDKRCPLLRLCSFAFLGESAFFLSLSIGPLHAFEVKSPRVFECLTWAGAERQRIRL